MEAEKLGNPAPLGLAGFGMTTILLNIHNTGIFPLGSMILAMGLVLWGGRPDYCGNPGVQERQHLRSDCLCLLWLFLVDPCLHPCFQGHSRGSCRVYGLVSLRVGGVHLLHVVRHVGKEQGAPVCLPEPHRAFLAPRHQGLERKSRHRDNRRMGRHHVRRLRPLPCHGGGNQ